jgi:hypothetical protein
MILIQHLKLITQLFPVDTFHATQTAPLPPLAFLIHHRQQQTLVHQDNQDLVLIIKEHHHVRLPREVLCGVVGLKPADHVQVIAFLIQHKVALQHLVLQGNQALSLNKEHHHVHLPREVLCGVDGLKQEILALRIAFLIHYKLEHQHLVLQGNQVLSLNKEHHHVRPLQEVLCGVDGLKQEILALRIVFLKQRKLVLQRLVLQGKQV